MARRIAGRFLLPLLGCLVLALPATLRADDDGAINPHRGVTLCLACHSSVEDFGLRDQDINQLCGRCHSTGAGLACLHPLPNVPPNIVPPSGWPLTEGIMTCLTCHLPGHIEDADKRMFLRGGPYERRRDVCFPCHPPQSTYFDPHLLLNSGGGCFPCHTERDEDEVDRHLRASADMICLLCHEEPAHPGGVLHEMRLEDGQKSSIAARLPLEGQDITCVTCHNPHVYSNSGFKLRTGVTGYDICQDCHGF